MTEVVRLLRERAESYSRDADVLRADGDDMRMVIAYRTIADELRKVADEVSARSLAD